MHFLREEEVFSDLKGSEFIDLNQHAKLHGQWHSVIHGMSEKHKQWWPGSKDVVHVQVSTGGLKCKLETDCYKTIRNVIKLLDINLVSSI